jgi:hypothetical protein
MKPQVAHQDVPTLPYLGWDVSKQGRLKDRLEGQQGVRASMIGGRAEYYAADRERIVMVELAVVHNYG